MPEPEATWYRQLLEGATLADVAQQVGVSRQRIHQRLQKYGVTARGIKRERLEHVAPKLQILSSEAVARELKGISTAQVRTFARERGLKPLYGYQQHGTIGSYLHGKCRCELCREANRHRMHELWRKKPRRYLVRYRRDRKPCRFCEKEGWTEPKPVNGTRIQFRRGPDFKPGVCRWCGGSHD